MLAAIDRQDGARHLNPGQIEELVALTELLVRRRLGRALNDGDGVANFGHDARAAGGELFLRERVGKQAPAVHPSWAL